MKRKNCLFGFLSVFILLLYSHSFTQSNCAGFNSLTVICTTPLQGGKHLVELELCSGGGFTVPSTSGNNGFVMDFLVEVHGNGVKIDSNGYPLSLNSGQSNSGCTNCRNACATFNSIGAWAIDPACMDLVPPDDTAKCYSCPGPAGGIDCPDSSKCPNGDGTCIWYSANDPCCNPQTTADTCNIPGFNFYTFWGFPNKPVSCPGPPNSSKGCRNWTYTDIYQSSGAAGAYCDTLWLILDGIPDSISLNLNTINCRMVIDSAQLAFCAPKTNKILGTKWNDADSNCVKDTNEIGLANWIFKASPGPYFGISDSSGNYSIAVPPGTYSVSEIQNPYWQQSCPVTGTYSVTTSTQQPDTSFGNNFGNYLSDTCANLWVDIGVPSLIRCQFATYTVDYCNFGNATASNVYITVQIDTLLTYISSSINYTSKVGSLYTFDIVQLNAGQCGSFTIKVAVNCNLSSNGVVQCAEALIYPPLTCQKIDSAWDKSSIKVWGYCQNDSLACFVIKNKGSGSMASTSEYRIFVNNVLVSKVSFQLNSGDSLIVCWPANGNVIRLEADQHPKHPGKSKPNDEVSLCGGSIPVLGQSNILPQDDDDDFKSIDCQPIVYPFDPNNKIPTPLGITSKHYIDSNQTIEYHINFQNTGTAPAGNVWVRDTLSADLDIASLVKGGASHSHQFNIKGSGILEWYFPNIQLPDSNTDEPNSHGFVKFKITPKSGLAKGTVIENWADIYFDFELPVRTDTAFNTIYDTTIVMLDLQNSTSSELNIKVYPNPAGDAFFVEGDFFGEARLELMDPFGRLSRSVHIRKSPQRISTEGLSDGVYIYSVEDRFGRKSMGKLILLR